MLLTWVALSIIYQKHSDWSFMNICCRNELSKLNPFIGPRFASCSFRAWRSRLRDEQLNLHNSPNIWNVSVRKLKYISIL